MWVPDPALPLFGGSELASVDILISYAVDDVVLVAPTSYSGLWLSASYPSAVTFSSSVSGLHLSGPNAIGMGSFGLDYMTDKVSYHITKWEDLPPSAQEIYSYQAPSSNVVTAQLQVNAHFASGPDLIATYTFMATLDYSSGRDRLALEVNLRR